MRSTSKRSSSQHPPVQDAGAATLQEVLARHAGRREVLLGQVDAAAVEVLTDVADEVAHLERLAEQLRAVGRLGLHPRQRLQHREHLQADDVAEPYMYCCRSP